MVCVLSGAPTARRACDKLSVKERNRDCILRRSSFVLSTRPWCLDGRSRAGDRLLSDLCGGVLQREERVSRYTCRTVSAESRRTGPGTRQEHGRPASRTKDGCQLSKNCSESDREFRRAVDVSQATAACS